MSDFEVWLDSNRDARVSEVFHDIIANYDALKTELADTKRLAMDNSNWFDALKVDYDEIQAELEVLKAQEPVAWFNAKMDMTYMSNFHSDDIPLYLAAGCKRK
jgi:hypothetical protein